MTAIHRHRGVQHGGWSRFFRARRRPSSSYLLTSWAAAGMGCAIALSARYCSQHGLGFSFRSRTAAGAERAVLKEMEHKMLEHVDLAVGVMLIGSVMFYMSLFYIVNHSDQDIRRFSWEIVSSTVTIFSAVMVFQAITGVFDGFGSMLSVGPVGAIGINCFEFVLWFVVMHWRIASMAFSDEEGHSSDEKREDKEAQMKCWGGISAHITGFAAISAGCSLQRMHMLSGMPAATFVVVALQGVVLFVFFRISSAIRARSGLNHMKEASEWDEEAEEAENDIAALSLSFLTVQSLCYSLSGTISEEEPLDLSGKQHPYIYIVTLLGFGALFLLLAFYLAKRFLNFLDAEGEYHHKFSTTLDSFSTYINRWEFVILSSSAMCFAWSMLFAARWSISHEFNRWNIHLHTSSTVKAVFLALVISKLALASVFGMNVVHDNKQSPIGQRVARILLHSFGILIGFSWEQSFDASVEIISELTAHPVVVKIALALFVVLIVVPAWRFHILKTLLQLRKEHLKCEVDDDMGSDVLPIPGKSPGCVFGSGTFSSCVDSETKIN